MKKIVFLVCGLWVGAFSVLAQERIYRCGNEYTNTVPQAQAKNCKLVENGNVTVVQGTRLKPASAKTPVAPGSTPDAGAKLAAQDLAARDADARLILQSELKKAEARQQELIKEYNNGEPEKRGEETRNAQKYLDRVADIKTSLTRNESDIASIRRELGRLPGSGK
jgi:hypothetical protein